MSPADSSGLEDGAASRDGEFLVRSKQREAWFARCKRARWKQRVCGRLGVKQSGVKSAFGGQAAALQKSYGNGKRRQEGGAKIDRRRQRRT